jgi:CheY-like chemotaxis protein
MNVSPKKILVVEDEFLIAAALGIQIEAMGHHFCGSAPSAYRGIVMARDQRPDLVLMDMRLEGDVDGVDAALAIYQIVNAKIIFITGSKEPTTLERIALAHPAAVLFKPCSSNELQRAINETLS